MNMRDVKYYEDLVNEILTIAGNWKGYENSPDPKVVITAKRHIREAAIVLQKSFHKLKEE